MPEKKQTTEPRRLTIVVIVPGGSFRFLFPLGYTAQRQENSDLYLTSKSEWVGTFKADHWAACWTMPDSDHAEIEAYVRKMNQQREDHA